jgi:putative flippase GtrA
VLQRVAKSAVVGAAATALDLCVLLLLVDIFGIEPRAANVPSLLGGVLAQFIGNKLFAFGDRSRDWGRQGLWFGVVEVGALALNALAFDLLVAQLGVPPIAARIAGSGLVYFGFSYPLWTRIFRREAFP